MLTVYRNLKVYLKILIPVVTLIGVILASFTMYLLEEERQTNRINLNKKADRLNSLLSLSTAESVWNYDYSNVEEIARAFFGDQEISLIHIIDNEQQEIVRLARDEQDKYLSDAYIKRAKNITKNGNVVGIVKLVMNNSQNQAAIREFSKKLVWLALLIFSGLCLLIWLISRNTLKPLTDILKGISELSAGNYQYLVEVKASDELGKVASQFNTMSSKIQTLQQEAVLSAMVGVEMQIATDIQLALQPQLDSVSQNSYEIAALMMPADEVGGDYYDFLRDVDNRLWLGIGDVTGHGLLSGLVMMMTQVAANTLLQNVSSLTPTKLLVYINKILHANIKQGLKANHHMTISFLCEVNDGHFLFAGAHETILIYRAKTGEIEHIDTKGMWLGIIPDISKQTVKGAGTFNMEKGDVCLLYTDGVIEIMNEEREQYDTTRLSNFIKDLAPKKSMQEMTDALYQSLMEFKEKQLDDITYLFFKKN